MKPASTVSHDVGSQRGRAVDGTGARGRAARFLLLMVALVSVSTACLGPVTKLSAIEAVRLPETSDPAVAVADGQYFVYGSNNHLRAPITRLSSVEEGLNLWQKNSVTFEGMPTRPAWVASSTQMWAPTVGQFGSNWVMFFAADRWNPPQAHNAQCVGRAWSSSPGGPFTPEPNPVHCGIAGVGGALDPEVFTDKNGRRYLLMAFGDTESPIHVVSLDENANLVGDAVPILKRQHPWEYHFIEQPSMIWDPVRDNYILTYSAGRWWEAAYSTGIARCTTPVGPCFSDPSGPWVAASNGRSGPGGLSFFRDTEGAARAIFSTFAAGHETQVGGRAASVMYVKFDPAMALQVVK